MRHHNQNRKFGRVRKVRRAMMNSLARSLVLRQKIETTEAKAKELRPFVEKLVTKGKLNTLSARRAVNLKVGKDAGKILVDSLSKEYQDRKGGYLRIVKIKNRFSDGSRMAVIEFVKK